MRIVIQIITEPRTVVKKLPQTGEFGSKFAD
jgi:hypothetical protein